MSPCSSFFVFVSVSVSVCICLCLSGIGNGVIMSVALSESEFPSFCFLISLGVFWRMNPTLLRYVPSQSLEMQNMEGQLYFTVAFPKPNNMVY